MKLIALLTARKALPLDISDVDIQLRYKIAKFIKSTLEEETFYVSEVNKIIDEVAVKNESGEIVRDDDGSAYIKDGMRPVFDKKMAALRNTDVDIPRFSLTLDEVSALKLSVRDMIAIDDFIND